MEKPQYYEDWFASLKKEMEEVSGEWNGDNPGIEEDNAHIANEIIEKVDEVIALIKELNGTH